ncbi:MAG: HAD-IA family hydrolase [Chthoniobacteraceae bacterium]
MPAPRVIFFDAAGTLIGLPRGVAHHYCEVAARHGLALDPNATTEAFRMAWREMPTPEPTRVPRPDDDRGWWESLVHLVLDKCAVPRRGAFDRRAYFAELYDEFTRPGVWDLFPDVRPVLTRLAQTYELGIISNFDRRLRFILDELALTPLFRHVVISSEVGADKPDPWIFEHALALVGVQPHEALHVGDEPAADWEGAERAGLQVFRLKRPELTLEHLARLMNRDQ